MSRGRNYHNTFPEGFIWGAATSSYQAEGGNRSDWTGWEQQSGRIRDGSVAGEAADHWRRWKADFGYLSELGLNGYRFSLEWSRIEPKQGKFDEEALDRYAEMLAELKRRGIRPMVTIHHFTVPVWAQGLGGWRSGRVVSAYLDYVRKVVDRLGDQVGLWCTLNEPGVQSVLGYLVGVFPPGQKSLVGYLRARRNLVRAHKQAYWLIHETYADKGWGEVGVSLAHHFSYVEPRDLNNFFDRVAAWVYGRVSNDYFLKTVGQVGDFVGINYYFFRRVYLKWSRKGVEFGEEPVKGAKSSDLGWQIVPEGLYRTCKAVMALGKPIYITENGLADADDTLRGWSIVAHAQVLARAIKEGADVRGYFHWSLLDGFEWENGYLGKYGLVDVNFTTQERQVRTSARVYEQIARANGVPPVVAEKYS